MSNGEEILKWAVKLTYGDGLGDTVRGAWTGSIVSRLTGGRSTDGRSIAAKLRSLEKAGLVKLTREGGGTYVLPTVRGREVDAILERITASRGGTLAPRSKSGITLKEKLVL